VTEKQGNEARLTGIIRCNSECAPPLNHSTCWTYSSKAIVVAWY